MSTPVIEGSLIDEENEDKFWVHGVTVASVLQVLDSPYRVQKNRKERRAAYLIIGRDRQGRCLAIPIEPTYDAKLWRPVTAWSCKASEWSRLP